MGLCGRSVHCTLGSHWLNIPLPSGNNASRMGGGRFACWACSGTESMAARVVASVIRLGLRLGRVVASVMAKMELIMIRAKIRCCQ